MVAAWYATRLVERREPFGAHPIMTWAFDAAWWQVALLGAYLVVVLLAVSRHVLVTYELRQAHFLTPRSKRFEEAEAPLVSILVPAKDEAGVIEACLASLCAQDYPNIEILVVDDRSQDETAAIVTRWAARDSRIRLLRVFELPPHWTGKTHALHQCQKLARGKWLFFVDADTRLHPSCLSIALRDCLDAGAGMESIMPSLTSESFCVNVAQPLCSMHLMVLYRLSQMNNPACKETAFANGQFILIRRDVYRAIGGHEAVRTQVVEDIQLARLARAHDVPLRVVLGPQLASVRMYSTVRGMVSGWSRIFYSVVDQGVGPLRSLIAMLALSAMPYAILLFGGTALLAGSSSVALQAAVGMALVHEVSQLILYGRLYAASGTSLRFLPFRIVGLVVLVYLLRKTIRICRTHELTCAEQTTRRRCAAAETQRNRRLSGAGSLVHRAESPRACPTL